MGAATLTKPERVKEQTMKRLILATALALVLGGCDMGGSGGITAKNYQKIEQGMSLADVEKILGKGTLKPESVSTGPSAEQERQRLKDQGLESYTWENGDKIIAVRFLRGKAVNKRSMGLGLN
jgi:hypothetical protein